MISSTIVSILLPEPSLLYLKKIQTTDQALKKRTAGNIQNYARAIKQSTKDN